MKNNIHGFTDNIAFFQIKFFSRFHYVLLCNLQLVYGSGNGYIHDYITRRNKTERKLLLETAQCQEWHVAEKVNQSTMVEVIAMQGGH